MIDPLAGRGRRAPEIKGLIALHGLGNTPDAAVGYAGLSRTGYMRNPVAHRCVRLVAEAAASVPLMLTEEGAEHDVHPLLDLLARPNPRQPGASLLEAIYGHLLLAGDAFVERVDLDGSPRELHALRPDRVEVEADARGWPDAFTVREGTTKRRLHAEGGAVLHLALFHPLDDARGHAPIEAASGALEVHNAASRWARSLLENAARPSGALVYAPKEGGNLTDEQFDRLKAELEGGYAGATNAGRPMLLEGGLDWKAMSLTPQEMDFVEARAAAARDIALALGVPPMLLGIPGDATYSNYAEANRALLRLTVLPLVTRTAAALSNWLGRAWGGDARLAPDLDGVPGLAVEREALWSRISDADFITRAEKRAAVGYAPDANPEGSLDGPDGGPGEGAS